MSPYRSHKPKIIVTSNMPVTHLEPLADAAQIVMPEPGRPALTRDEVLVHTDGLHAVMNSGELRIDDAFLNAAPELKIVSNMAAGFDNLDLAALDAHGVWGTNTPVAFTDATADAALGLLLAVVRRICEGDRYVRAGRWQKDGFRPADWDGMRLRDKTLGVVGYGKIGRAVARRAEAFGMKVIQYSRSSNTLPNYRPIDELVAQSDVVSVHVFLNADTHRLFDEALIAKLKPGAVVVNTSRGAVVDEVALLEAVRCGHLAGAALDVFENEPEPLPEWSELENVVLTPHVGGSTVDGRLESRRLAAQNVALALRGETPVTPLNTPKH